MLGVKLTAQIAGRLYPISISLGLANVDSLEVLLYSVSRSLELVHPERKLAFSARNRPSDFLLEQFKGSSHKGPDQFLHIDGGVEEDLSHGQGMCLYLFLCQ